MRRRSWYQSEWVSTTWTISARPYPCVIHDDDDRVGVRILSDGVDVVGVGRDRWLERYSVTIKKYEDSKA